VVHVQRTYTTIEPSIVIGCCRSQDALLCRSLHHVGCPPSPLSSPLEAGLALVYLCYLGLFSTALLGAPSSFLIRALRSIAFSFCQRLSALCRHSQRAILLLPLVLHLVFLYCCLARAKVAAGKASTAVVEFGAGYVWLLRRRWCWRRRIGAELQARYVLLDFMPQS
jgi:hypothetical protein